MGIPLGIDIAGAPSARDAIAQLAKQTGHVIALAQKVYESECDKLRDDARVTDFIAALALRRTRDKLIAMQRNRRMDAANSSYELFSA